MLPRTRETANQIEKSRDSSSDRVRPVVPTSSKGPFCQKCKEFGHAIECCTAGTTQESGAEISVTTSSSSKEEMHKGNILKAAIQAALLRRPEIYKKKEVSNQTDEVSTSGTDLNCEVTSNDPILVSSTPKNSMSVEETPEQQEILENSTSDSSKCSSANDFKQLKSCPTDFRSQPGKLGSICLAAGKPVVRDMSDKAMTLSILPSKTLAFPEYEYIWQYGTSYDELACLLFWISLRCLLIVLFRNMHKLCCLFAGVSLKCIEMENLLIYILDFRRIYPLVLLLRFLVQ